MCWIQTIMENEEAWNDLLHMKCQMPNIVGYVKMNCLNIMPLVG